MKTKSMLLIMIALVCGLIASIGISQVMERGNGSAQSTPTSPIFVALAHIDIGDALDSSNVKLEQWQRDRIPEGAIQSLEQLEARFARQRLYPGEPILEAKLMDSNAGDSSSKIPEGYRVCSIKVTMDTSVSNLIKPGDRVDLIAFFRKSGEVMFTGARTILRDVRVFAINDETERAVDKDGQVSSAKTVSLLAKPHQVEMVTLAGHLGKLQLSLRRPDDQTAETYGEITIDDLLNSNNEVADDRDPHSSSAQKVNGSDENFLTFLQRNSPESQIQSAQPPPPASSPSQASPVASDPQVVHTMTVLTPTGNLRYEWQDEEELPRQKAGAERAVPSGGSPVPSAGGRSKGWNPPPGVDGGTLSAEDATENGANFNDTSGNDSRNEVESADLTEGSRYEAETDLGTALGDSLPSEMVSGAGSSLRN